MIKRALWTCGIFLLVSSFIVSSCRNVNLGNIQIPGLPPISNSSTGNGSNSQTAGITRKTPIKLGKLVSLPSWDIQVTQFYRGQQALKVINAGEWKPDPAPEGKEYVLAKVFVRCTSLDEKYHSIGISQMFITGDRNVSYGDMLDGWPQPEFLFEDMYTAEQVEGWVDAIVPVDEHNLELVFDDNENGDRTVRFFELGKGASISLLKNSSGEQVNEIGIDKTQPASVGQKMVSSNWEVTVIAYNAGGDAEQILQNGNSYYAQPEQGEWYALLEVKIKYVSQTDAPAWVGADRFYGLGSDGYAFNTSWIYLPEKSDLNWLGSNVLPGAELQGWVAVRVPAGDTTRIVAFDPGINSSNTNSEPVRYVILK